MIICTYAETVSVSVTALEYPSVHPRRTQLTVVKIYSSNSSNSINRSNSRNSSNN